MPVNTIVRGPDHPVLKHLAGLYQGGSINSSQTEFHIHITEASVLEFARRVLNDPEVANYFNTQAQTGLAISNQPLRAVSAEPAKDIANDRGTTTEPATRDAGPSASIPARRSAVRTRRVDTGANDITEGGIFTDPNDPASV